MPNCLDAAINEDEAGNVLATTSAWTGTLANGTADFGEDCTGWADNTGGTARTGNPKVVNTTWTFATTESCTVARNLYCFQQGNPATPVTLQSFTVD